MTWSQTNALVITAYAGCQHTMTQFLRESSYYRTFVLADHGATDGFVVNKVTFAVASAASSAPSKAQLATLKIHAYSGPTGQQTLEVDKMVERGSTDVMVADTDVPAIIDVPMSAALTNSDVALVVELHFPDGFDAMHKLLVGGNRAGETAPAYQRAPLCGTPTPVTLPAAGVDNFALVLMVTGEG